MAEYNIVAIIEARMNSSRLPGKHMLMANGKPMLQHLIERLQQVSIINKIVIATTKNPTDDILVHLAGKNGVGIYRGSENDVMGRVIEAGEAYSADVICEVTGDCSIIDPELVENLLQTFLSNNASYVCNGRHGLPGGMGAQVFLLDTLKRSVEMTQDILDHEHVTLHMRHNPELFPPIYLVAPKSLHWPELMLLLDEKDDFKLMKRVIEHFGNINPYFCCREVIQLLRERPDWVRINHHVRRKGDT